MMSIKLVQERLAFIGFLKDSPSMHTAGLKVIHAGEYSLVPAGQYLLHDHDTLALIANYIPINSNDSHDKCTANISSAKHWLETHILLDTSRIVFLVANSQGRYVGYISLASIDNPKHILEIENILIWADYLPPHTSTCCLTALIEWARTTMYTEGFTSRVLSSDSSAISLYRNNGFRDAQTTLDSVSTFSTENFTDPNGCIESRSEYISEILLEMHHEENTHYLPDSLILTAGPSISQYETYYAYDAALNGWNSEWSKYLDIFQRKFKDYVGAKYALATSSCTGALHIALLALGIGEGDEVIVPDQTWVATANAVRYVQATPVFVDINKTDWTINPIEIQRAITPRTKAIIPVHMYGHPANMSHVVEIANKYNLFIVEDAAPSIGAEFNGKKTGSFGHFAAFSFQGAKLMVTGEGGMLLTNDDELYLKAKKIWDQG